MRVLVCGGRMFGRPYPDGSADDILRASRDVLHLNDTLNRLDAETPITWIIEGDAPGADRLAGGWASARGLNLLVYPADWRSYGRAAGPIRNKQMLDEGKPDLVVAFPGGAGTANMVKQAKAAGVKVIEVQSGRHSGGDG